MEYPPPLNEFTLLFSFRSMFAPCLTLYIKVVDTSDEQLFELRIDVSASVNNLKAMIHETTGIPPPEQEILLSNGELLRDHGAEVYNEGLSNKDTITVRRVTQ